MFKALCRADGQMRINEPTFCFRNILRCMPTKTWRSDQLEENRHNTRMDSAKMIGSIEMVIKETMQMASHNKK